MKKAFILSVLLMAGQMFVQAQNIEITPFGGYVFPAKWGAENGSLYFDGNAMYGGMFSLGISPVMDVDLIYNRIDTKVLPDIVGYTYDEIAVSQNYYMVGITKNFRVSEVSSPFIGFNLGGMYLAPKDTDYYSYWFFALGLDAGVKVYLGKSVGLRFQAQMLMPVQSGGFYFYGSGGSVNVTSTLIDFGITGGLIFRIGD